MERHLNPPSPPPVVFWLTDLSCCCSMHHLLAESQMRLDEVLHIEIILVWHSFFFFSLSVASLFLRLRGFLGQRGAVLQRGRFSLIGAAWSQSGWRWETDISARHLLFDENTLSFCLCDLQNVKSDSPWDLISGVWRNICRGQSCFADFYFHYKASRSCSLLTTSHL